MLLPLSETHRPTRSLDLSTGVGVHPDSASTVATATPITLSTVLRRLLVIATCSSLGASRPPRDGQGEAYETQHRSDSEAKARVPSSVYP